jgi:putative colanic acid biosynthesis UDP-glucose lipid carrier transferase
MDFITLNALVIFLHSVMQRLSYSYRFEYSFYELWLNLSWLIVCLVTHLYHQKYILSFETFSRRTMHTYFYWLVLATAYLFFTRQFALSRLFIAYTLAGHGLLLVCNRFLYLAFHHHLQQNINILRKVVIVGYNPTAKKLAGYLEEEGRYTEILGFCEEDHNINELTHYPILSPVNKALEVSQLHGVHEIYSTLSPEDHSGIDQLIEKADEACIRVNIIPDLTSFINRPFHFNYVNDLPVFSLRNTDMDDAGNLIRKRLFDVVVSSLVILFILSWLIPVLALIIRIESPGPIFFRQLRTGKNNQPFWCLKFRSMRVNRDAHSKQACRNDERLTKVGKLLRSSSLDEFPQFINVFRGDMSIVGPRPHMLKHTEDYAKVINKYMVRQFLKPGITGWAQVNGYRGETRTNEQMQQRVEHDLWYMEHWSLWLDVRIIFLTVFSIFKGDQHAF